MAWVGFAELDEAKSVRPVAQAGFEEGYLEQLGIVWADVERGRGPAGGAIRTRKPVVIRDTLRDSRFGPWRAEALKRGYASVIGLPLLDNGMAFGVLTIYATRPGAFDAAEVKLLMELADDLAFGLVAIRTRAEGKRAEVAIRELGRKNEEALRVAQMGHWEYDIASGLFTFNDQYYTLHGTSAAQVGGYQMSATEFATKYVHPEDAHLVQQAIGMAVASHDPNFEFQTEARILRADGQMRTVFCWFRVDKDAQGRTVRLHGVNQDITERKRTQAALERSQTLLSESQAIAHLGSWEYDLVTDRLTWSEEVYRILGVGPQEFGATYGAFFEFVHPDDRAALDRAYLQSVRQEREGFEMEHRIVKRDTGETRTVHAKCIHVKNKAGKVVRSIGMLHDITERKQVEAALRQSEERYRSLFEHMMDGFALAQMLFDENGAPEDYIYLNVNAAFERVTGLKEVDVINRKASEVIPGLHQANPELLDILATVVRSGEPTRFETFVRPLKIWLLVSVYRPKAGHFAAVFNNITERKQTEAALRASEERHRMILQTAMDGFCRVDLQGRVLEVSDAFCRMNGYTKEELLAMHISELEATETRAEMEAHFRKIVEQREDRFESWHRRKDGSRFPVEVSAQYKSGEGGYLVAFVRDLTERKRVETELARHREHLEELVTARTADLKAANRDLEAFSYSVSHDLRAPLRAIDGYLHILLEDFGPSLDQHAHRLLSVIFRQTDLMAQLIDDLLRFSRMGRQPMQRVKVDLGTLAQEAFHEQVLLHPNQFVEVKIGPLPPAAGDPAMIRIVLNNLLSNAFKYSRGRSPARIEIGGFEEGAQNAYFVKDNGVGFDMKYVGKLFGVFQRLHPDQFEGTGVGLALVERIIHRHRGRVWAEGKPDQGATFYFSLPAGKPAQRTTAN